MEKFLFTGWFLLCFSIFGQSFKTFQYINPKPGSKYASPESNIIIKEGSILDGNSIDEKLISVFGDRSGIHEGNFLLSDDSKTLVFNPHSLFFPFEKVTVYLNEGIRTEHGKEIEKLEFEFYINRESKPDDFIKLNINSDYDLPAEYSDTYSQGSIQEDIPQILINYSNNPSPGYLFLAPNPYLLIIDNDAVPIFYRKTTGGQIYDFKLQPNGEITYFSYPVTCIGLDSSLNFTRNFVTSNGYTVDIHDLIVLPGGHYYILGKKLVKVDMSDVAPDGSENAEVTNMAVQEFDSSGNVVFEWSALDHYEITDADSYISLTNLQIDFVHLNSIELDTDGNIIISARNLNEITKIDHNSGEIIWRLGGEQNQFTFINDEIGFSRQHDARRLSNGNISLFDNGTYHNVKVSSFLEYELDEENMTATLIKRYTRNNLFSRTRGNVQELPNGNKLISWGELSRTAVTEITPDDSIAYELGFASNNYHYRSFRFQWETNLFKTGVDSIDFGEIELNDSVKKEIVLYNEKDSSVTINEFFIKDSSFSVVNKFPLIINGNDSLSITVSFNPENNGIFTSNLYFRSKNSNGFIARKVSLKGKTINFTNLLESPTNLQAEYINNEINLTWEDNSNNEEGFVIERKEGDSLSTPGFRIIDTASVNDTFYIDTLFPDTTIYTYRVYAFNSDTTSALSNLASTTVITSVTKNYSFKDYALFQNYPNPFNPTTTIRYKVGARKGRRFVSLKVYDILGNEITTLVNEKKDPGEYTAEFGRNMINQIPSGVYFYQLKIGSKDGKRQIYSNTKKLILLK